MIQRLTIQQKRDIVDARNRIHKPYHIEQTPEGPLVSCNFDCDYDEAEGGLYRQCGRCLRVQAEMREEQA